MLLNMMESENMKVKQCVVEFKDVIGIDVYDNIIEITELVDNEPEVCQIELYYDEKGYDVAMYLSYVATISKKAGDNLIAELKKISEMRNKIDFDLDVINGKVLSITMKH
jgi:hypothetical protein